MKVLVTGAAGFLGSVLSAALEGRGHEVIGVGRNPDTKAEPRSGFVELDLERGPAAGVDAVVHLACTTQPATSDAALARDITENVGASAEFFRRCAEAGVGRVVLASSGGTVYGEMFEGARAWRETDPTGPLTAHGAMKLAVESYLRVAAAGTAMRPVVARISNAYGRREASRCNHGAVEAIVRAVLAGKEIVLWGDGSAVRDYIHVDDVASALVAMVESPTPAPIYNVGTGRATSLVALIEHVEATTGRPAHVRREEARRVDLRRNVLDTGLLERDLAWKPCVSLEAGIARLASHLGGVSPGDLDPLQLRHFLSAG